MNFLLNHLACLSIFLCLFLQVHNYDQINMLTRRNTTESSMIRSKRYEHHKHGAELTNRTSMNKDQKLRIKLESIFKKKLHNSHSETKQNTERNKRLLDDLIGIITDLLVNDLKKYNKVKIKPKVKMFKTLFFENQCQRHLISKDGNLGWRCDVIFENQNTEHDEPSYCVCTYNYECNEIEQLYMDYHDAIETEEQVREYEEKCEHGIHELTGNPWNCTLTKDNYIDLDNEDSFDPYCECQRAKTCKFQKVLYVQELDNYEKIKNNTGTNHNENIEI